MIERFSATDTDELMQLWLSSAKSSHPFLPEQYWQDHLQTVRQEYLPAAQTFVIKEEGCMVAFASVIRGSYLGALFVAPAWQNHGFGAQLLEYCRAKFPDLFLSVYAENQRAVKFYLSHGFCVLQTQEGDCIGHMEHLMGLVRSQ